MGIQNKISAENCPRFDRCSAPICPLDPEWGKRVHLRDERVCAYLRKHAKNTTRANDDGGYEGELEKVIVEAYPRILEKFPPIKRELARTIKRYNRMNTKEVAA